MKIYHCSDWHGDLSIDSYDADVVVCSGDLMPNRTRGIRSTEEPFQRAWVNANLSRFRALICDKPFLYVSGNHDYIDPCPLLRNAGMNAINIDDRSEVVQGVKFYGFPWVPWFYGEWNFELKDGELEARMNEIDLTGVDVLVAHSPPYLVRDKVRGEHAGNKFLSRLLSRVEKVPALLLCGHIHEGLGVSEMHYNPGGGCIVSNAATSSRMLNL